MRGPYRFSRGCDARFAALTSGAQRRADREGGSKFTNVSKQLLCVVADINGDGTLDRVPLFDDRRQSYFWQYDNNGLRIAQMRFYEVATNVN
jgi:hypothetical protein